MTLPEVLLWRLLRRGAIGARVRRQHPIGPYVLDFFIPDAQLALEIDGAAHDIAHVAERDARRDAWLEARGIAIMRFNAADVIDAQRRNDVVATIMAAVARR